MNPCILPLAAVVGLHSSPSSTALPQQACNHESRTLQAPKSTETTTVDCAVWSIEILGVTITSPGTCVSSRTERLDDTFSCGPDSEGVHCDPRGHQVPVKTYFLEQPCPGIPSSIPETVEHANRLIQCATLPLASSVSTWSATTRACAPEPAPGSLPPIGGIVELGGGAYLRHTGDPTPLLTGAPPELGVPALRTALGPPVPQALPQALRDVVRHHPPLAGVDGLVATVEEVWPARDGRPELRVRQRVEGRVLADGRFAVRVTHAATVEGAPTMVTEELAFDGSCFWSGTLGAERYSVWAPTCPELPLALALGAQAVLPLVDWLRDPFLVASAPGTEYASDLEPGADGESRLRVVESYAAVDARPPLRSRTIYQLALDGLPRPLRIETVDARGRVTRRRHFADYAELGPAAWRPMRAVDARGGDAAPRRVRTLAVERARPLTPEQAREPVPRIRPARDEWFVHL